MDRPISLYSFPRAILHIDGDAFFASCEQACDPKLRHKPVVTGLERGIASSMSYEAKALGVTRGMPIHDIRRFCPECAILPSDYETYGLMSLRMYAIVRRFTVSVVCLTTVRHRRQLRAARPSRPTAADARAHGPWSCPRPC